MRCFRAWLVVSALLAEGCAASADSDSGGTADPFGGQTGSLVPPNRGLAPRNGAVSVPGGDGAFIVRGNGLDAGDVHVTDASGADVSVELVPLDDGTFLARVPGMLAAGTYDVSVDGADVNTGVDLNVSDPVPLPMRLGDLQQTSAPQCGSNFALSLDALALAYAPLLRLTGRLDGGPSTVWIDYGLIAPNGNTVNLPMDCHCLSGGSHRLELSADIAGEATMPDPAVLDFDVPCKSKHGGCALGQGMPSGGVLAGWFVAACVVLGAFWRRRWRGSRGR